MNWDNMQAIEKANFVVSSLSSGGLLVAEQAEEFLRVAIKASKALGMVTVKPMARAQYEIPNIRFAGRVLKPGNEGQALGLNDRATPTLGKATLSTKLFKGECRINDEVFEDNIEQDQLKATVLATIGERVSADMEDVVLNGDTTSSDTTLAQLDGLIKQVVSNLVAAGGVKLAKSVLRDLWKTLPIEFRRDKSKMKYLTGPDAEIDYRDTLTDRATPEGDKTLTGSGAPVNYSGVEVVDVPLFSQTLGGGNETAVILADPKNAYVGVQRDIKIEPWRDPAAGQNAFTITLRMDTKWSYEPAVAKATGVIMS